MTKQLLMHMNKIIGTSVGADYAVSKINPDIRNSQRGPINRRCARYIGTYECTDYFVKLHYRPNMHQPKLHHTVMLSRSEASRCPARETFTAFQGDTRRKQMA
jgi:hypothetical protein